MHPEIGLWGFVEDDLTRTTVSTTYDEKGGAFGSWFGAGGKPNPTTRAHEIGAARAGGLLTIGLALDI